MLEIALDFRPKGLERFVQFQLEDCVLNKDRRELTRGATTVSVGPQRRRLAIATVAAEIGAIAMSRAIAKTDPAFSDEVLEAVQDTLKAAHELKRSGRTTPLTRQRRTNQGRSSD